MFEQFVEICVIYHLHVEPLPTLPALLSSTIMVLRRTNRTAAVLRCVPLVLRLRSAEPD